MPGRGVPEHRGQELVPVQPVDGGGGAGADRRGPRDGVQQRDLSHALAAAESPQLMPILDGLELARGDRIVSVGRISLPDQNVCGGQRHRFERRRQAFQRGRGQLGEQRQRAQQRDLDHWDRDTGIEPEDGPAARQGGQR